MWEEQADVTRYPARTGGPRAQHPPLEHTRVEGEEGVQWVRAGLHRVPSSCVSNNREHLAIVPLNDRVAENQLVFTAEAQDQTTDRRG